MVEAGGVSGCCSAAVLSSKEHVRPGLDGTTKCLHRFGSGGGDIIIGRFILLPLDGDIFRVNESSSGGGVEILHLTPAHADEESLSAAGLEGALFGLTSIAVVVVLVIVCMMMSNGV